MLQISLLVDKPNAPKTRTCGKNPYLLNPNHPPPTRPILMRQVSAACRSSHQLLSLDSTPRGIGDETQGFRAHLIKEGWGEELR